MAGARQQGEDVDSALYDAVEPSMGSELHVSSRRPQFFGDVARYWYFPASPSPPHAKQVGLTFQRVQISRSAHPIICTRQDRACWSLSFGISGVDGKNSV